MMIIEQEASSSGTQPPSTTLTILAARKAKSIERKKAMKASARQSGQFHFCQTTTKASDVVTTIVPVTAMP